MATAIPEPHPTPDSAEFWEALRQHELRIPYCGECDTFFFPPMPGCPSCGAGEYAVQMRRVSGRGRVYSWFVAHHAFHPAFEADVPYVVLDVDLEEGPRVYGRLIGESALAVTAGMDVDATFEDLDGFTRLGFVPRESVEEDR